MMKFKMLCIILIIAIVSMCGCVGDNSEENPTEDVVYDKNLVAKIDTYNVVYKCYDEDTDVVIYIYSGYDKGGIVVIPNNEIEYWKAYNVTS